MFGCPFLLCLCSVWDWADGWVSSRFLRARRFDVNGAWGQFKDTEDWRKDNAIEDLYENIDVEAYDAARRMVCYFVCLGYARLTAAVSSMDGSARSPRYPRLRL